MLRELTKQAVHHTDGYIVQSAGPEGIHYIDPSMILRVEADLRSIIIPVYTNMYEATDWRGKSVHLDDGELEIIMKRIATAYSSLGSPCELVAGDP
jgi:hypothetical protein